MSITGSTRSDERDSSGLADALGAYSAQLSYSSIPPAVADHAKGRLLDAIGLMIASRETDVWELVAQYARTKPVGRAPVVGAGHGVDAATSAFLNGVLMHALNQDDGDLESGHPGCMIVPAALATAAEEPCSGADLLTAIIAGYELMWRGGARGLVLKGAIARGVRGWLLSGSIGAAAASSRVRKLSADATSAAISCAANWSSGLLEPVGEASLERCLTAGAQARSGVEAAGLAACGLEGTTAILEGSEGYFAALAGLDSTHTAVVRSLDGLGSTFRIAEAVTKAYTNAFANQSAVFAADEFYRRHGTQQDVKSVTVWQSSELGAGKSASLAANAVPRSLEQALMSKPFAVSAMLVTGKLEVTSIREQMTDSNIASLLTKVTCLSDPSLAPLAAKLSMQLVGGGEYVVEVDGSTGTHFHPALDEMRTRFIRFVEHRIEERVIDRIIHLIDVLDEAGTSDELISVLAELYRTS